MKDSLITLIANNEGWLKKRVHEHAGKNGYSRYSSLLSEASRTSANRLISSIVKVLNEIGINSPQLSPDIIYSQDPLSFYGVIEAKINRKEGIALNVFMELIKLYRQSYIDLINEFINSPAKQNNYNLFINRCFDRIELGYITEWSNNPANIDDKEIMDIGADKPNKYLSVFESLFEPIIILDDHKRILNYNNAASKIFTNINISDKQCNNVISSQFLPVDVIDIIDRFNFSSENEVSFETFLNIDKEKKYYQVFLKKMIENDGKLKGIIIMFNDLTQHKEIEQTLHDSIKKAEESDQMKTAFLANMSHEIRTPMNAIYGFTELLLSTNPSRKERLEFLQMIRTSSNDLMTIIEDLIDIAKIESKQFKIKPKVCKPYSIITDLQVIFQEVLKRYGIKDAVELRVQVSEAHRNIVMETDKERLKQVLSNLLNNAAKFTDSGYIEFGYEFADRSTIIFFVKDSGMGIPGDMKDKIFNRFTQVESNDRKEYRGAGLGLAICKNIINLLGGNIWVESKPGKGSDFFFRLPLIKPSNESEAESIDTSLSYKEKISDWSERNLIIAEDDESNFIYLSELLKPSQIKILWAKNGMEAIDIAESDQKIDCILMDIKMPIISGIEATQYILGIRPEIPIIAQTAFALEGDKEKFLEAGCSAYITKPIKKEELFELLEKYIQKNKISKLKTANC